MGEEGRGFKGSIAGIELSDIIQLICTSTSGHLKIKVKSGANEGAICISGGQVVHAQTLRREGEGAFYEILSWPYGEFLVTETEPEIIGKITIHKPWQQLILESARLKDEGSISQAEESGKVIVYCDRCEKRFLVPSEKIPLGKKVRLKCPVCQNSIEVMREDEIEEGFETEIERWKREEPVVDDIFLDGRQGVLICSSDLESIDRLSQIFSHHDYNVKIAKTGREAFKYLREGLFEVVILDEVVGKSGGQEHNVLLFYIQRLPMNIRRKFFLCLLSNSLKTRDQWAAFRLGVDLVINRNSLELMDELLHYTFTYKKRFYAPFMEELQILRAS